MFMLKTKLIWNTAWKPEKLLNHQQPKLSLFQYSGWVLKDDILNIKILKSYKSE